MQHAHYVLAICNRSVIDTLKKPISLLHLTFQSGAVVKPNYLAYMTQLEISIPNQTSGRREDAQPAYSIVETIFMEQLNTAGYTQIAEGGLEGLKTCHIFQYLDYRLR